MPAREWKEVTDSFIATTLTSNNEIFDLRNLVTLSKYPLLSSRQVRNEYVGELPYRRITARPRETEAKGVSWERPTLHVKVDHPKGEIDTINLHLKSRRPSPAPGQQENFGFKRRGGMDRGLLHLLDETCWALEA